MLILPGLGGLSYRSSAAGLVDQGPGSRHAGLRVARRRNRS